MEELVGSLICISWRARQMVEMRLLHVRTEGCDVEVCSTSDVLVIIFSGLNASGEVDDGVVCRPQYYYVTSIFAKRRQ